jgi:hypothetical protein
LSPGKLSIEFFYAISQFPDNHLKEQPGQPEAWLVGLITQPLSLVGVACLVDLFYQVVLDPHLIDLVELCLKPIDVILFLTKDTLKNISGFIIA